MGDGSTRVLLGDDHTIFVDALVAALSARGFPVVGTAGSLAGTVAAVRRFAPDICLLDRFFGDGDGVARLGEVRAAGPGTKIVVLTADGDAHVVRGALSAGAAGYVNKMCGLEILVDALHAVAAGETVVSLAATRVPPQQQRGDALDARKLASYLTARERECLSLLTEGAQTATMAKSLGVSPTTVRTHVQAVLTKLGVHSRLEAASLALRHNLLETRTLAGR
ncbi:response regulator transcription factor [Saccharopolyspora sp. NFXS83]|uniref:LuxR C-terminal-related transcriptional regulator n=1 Tax=Saccharopolyspora sp. NFXS83 TaxID=2993560 RepID=UPI00224B8C52|nr:response regulator transcription factor [Saccharopolyspora sp. NFXS83]MCX2729993.1 response regulator transcription factor [Saccharopolyspora sp. NFXS83]